MNTPVKIISGIKKVDNGVVVFGEANITINGKKIDLFHPCRTVFGGPVKTKVVGEYAHMDSDLVRPRERKYLVISYGAYYLIEQYVITGGYSDLSLQAFLMKVWSGGHSPSHDCHNASDGDK